MQEIPRALLLPPPSHLPQRASARAVQIDSDSIIDGARSARREQGEAHAFLTLLDSRREDTVEIRGKQFRFRPYGNRGAVDGNGRDAQQAGETPDAVAIGTATEDEDVSLDVLEGFGAGARQRNSSAFIAGFIAQQRLSQGLHNPPFEAASDAYRRAGGSPSAIDGRARVVSVAV